MSLLAAEPPAETIAGYGGQVEHFFVPVLHYSSEFINSNEDQDDRMCFRIWVKIIIIILNVRNVLHNAGEARRSLFPLPGDRGDEIRQFNTSEPE